MNLERTEDELALAQSVREAIPAFFDFVGDDDAMASFAAKGLNRNVWQAVCDLGWIGVTVSEEQGGLGLDLSTQVLAFMELGQALAPTTFLSTALAAAALDTTPGDDLLPAILSGQRIVGTVVQDLVIDAMPGDLAIRLAPGQVEILGIDSAVGVAPSDELTTLAALDGNTVLRSYQSSSLVWTWQILVAAFLVGTAQRATQMSAEYARIREQFGKPIGSFQAVQHRIADMACRQYVASTQLLAASLYVGGVDPDAGAQAGSALLLAKSAAQRNAAENIQNHGAIGFSTEHRSGSLAKRANTLTQMVDVPLTLSVGAAQLDSVRSRPAPE